jgi:hypothetical protein
MGRQGLAQRREAGPQQPILQGVDVQRLLPFQNDLEVALADPLGSRLGTGRRGLGWLHVDFNADFDIVAHGGPLGGGGGVRIANPVKN